MRWIPILVVAAAVFLQTGAPGPQGRESMPSAAAAGDPVGCERVGAWSGGASFHGFVPNEGQLDARVLYHSQGGRDGVWFTREGAVFAWQGLAASAALDFVGADPGARVEGSGPLPTRVHRFVGADLAAWRQDLPLLTEVAYLDAWPGIDVVFRASPGRLKYEFVVRPGARPEEIALAWMGVDGLNLEDDGSLTIRTRGGPVLDDAPVGWQERGSQLKEVRVRYRLGERCSYGFEVGEDYDPARVLVIDPGLAFSGFLGGAASDLTPKIARDAAGALYVVGSTTSLDFPATLGAFDTVHGGGGFDAFVAKVDATGSSLEYVTFLGGSGSEFGEAIAVDPDGRAYVTGRTTSGDFPTTAGALDATLGGAVDAFVACLAPSGAWLPYSTLLGGSDTDVALGVVATGSGQVVVTGSTLSSDFPTTPGAFDTTYNGGFADAFVSRLDTTLSGPLSLLSSTFLGGTLSVDVGEDVALAPAGDVVLVGYTDCADFPTTPGAFDTTFNGGPGSGKDLFVARLDGTLATLVWATYLGGSGREFFAELDVDATGAAYVTARTSSSDFPTTPGAFDTTFGGSLSPEVPDAFVTKLNSSGTALLWSTFLGGSAADAGNDLSVAGGDVVVTGSTLSGDFPTTPDAYDLTHSSGAGDAFLVRLDGATSSLVHGTFLGGSASDAGLGVVANAQGSAFLVGVTASPDFPTTAASFGPTFHGAPFDVFVARISVSPSGHLDNLKDLVEALQASGTLNDGQARSLLAKLDAALGRVENGSPEKAVENLEAFVHEVEAFVRSGVLTFAEAQPLLDAAEEAIAILGG